MAPKKVPPAKPPDPKAQWKAVAASWGRCFVKPKEELDKHLVGQAVKKQLRTGRTCWCAARSRARGGVLAPTVGAADSIQSANCRSCGLVKSTARVRGGAVSAVLWSHWRRSARPSTRRGKHVWGGGRGRCRLAMFATRATCHCAGD